MLTKERLGKGNQLGFVMEIYVLSCSVIHVPNCKIKKILFCFLQWREEVEGEMTMEMAGFEPQLLLLNDGQCL